METQSLLKLKQMTHFFPRHRQHPLKGRPATQDALMQLTAHTVPRAARIPRLQSQTPLLEIESLVVVSWSMDQQVLEDLVNDLLCSFSVFVSTIPAAPAPPPRRGRQRPLHLASPSRAATCIPLDSPLARAPTGPPAVAPLSPNKHHHAALSPQHSVARKHPIDQGTGGKLLFDRTSTRTSARLLKDARGASRGPTPDFLPLARSSVHVSPLAHAARHRYVCAEHSGKVHHAKADTIGQDPATPRTQSADSLSQPSQSLGHFEPLQQARSLRPPPVEPTRAPPLRNGLRSMDFRSAAQAIRGTFGVRGRTVSNEDVAMIEWEHHQRLELAVRRRESVMEKDVGI